MCSSDLGPARREVPLDFPRLRVALLGCGAVGAGVLSYLQQRPDLFEVGPVLVRNPDRARLGGEAYTDDLDMALSGEPDLLVEALGGADYPADIMCAALRRGVHVVTANKAALARHYDALHACAEAGAAGLAYSSAVGGGTPVLEAVERLRDEAGVASVAGVMNGTCNFLLGRLAEGDALDDAVAEAQARGFAEADPSADVDGHDAADKLALLARRAFGVVLPVDKIAKESVAAVDPAAVRASAAGGKVLKQVGRCALLPDGSVEASVRIEALAADHPLAGAHNEENRFLVRCNDGKVHAVHGKGAGRWPTAASVFADVMDLQRRLASEARDAPLRLSA